MNSEVLRERETQRDIQERPDQSPDYLIEDPTLGNISIVVTQEGQEGKRFAFSAFYQIEKDGQATRRGGAIGMTRADAMEG